MQINNEFDMFNVLLSQAEKGKVDTENRSEFFEGIKELKRVLSFVKMREVEDGIIFERGFDTVKVSVKEIEDGMVELTYIKIDGFKEYKNNLTEAHAAAVGKFKLW